MYKDEDNNCKYGAGCHFAHGDSELRRSNENSSPTKNFNQMSQSQISDLNLNLGCNQQSVSSPMKQQQNFTMFTLNKIYPENFNNGKNLSFITKAWVI